MKKVALAGSLAFFFPLIAFAQAGNLTPFKTLVSNVGDIINMLIPILIALALVVFFWGLVKYVWGGGSDEARKQGKNIMIAGLVSLFVMVSVYGIIRLAQNALGVDSGTFIQVPQPPGDYNPN